MTVGKGVGKGGDATVGVDGEKSGLLLGVLGQVDFMGFIREAGREEWVSVEVWSHKCSGQDENDVALRGGKGAKPEFFKSDGDL